MFCAAAKIVVVDSREGSTFVLVIDISSLFVMEMFSNENETLTLKHKQTDGIVFVTGIQHQLFVILVFVKAELNLTLAIGVLTKKIAFPVTKWHFSWCSIVVVFGIACTCRERIIIY